MVEHCLDEFSSAGVRGRRWDVNGRAAIPLFYYWGWDGLLLFLFHFAL